MTAAPHDPIETLLDLFVYAPIGLVTSLLDAAPDLAERGRQRAGAARMVGRFALDGADARVTERLGDARRHLDAFLRIVAESSDTTVRRSTQESSVDSSLGDDGDGTADTR